MNGHHWAADGDPYEDQSRDGLHTMLQRWRCSHCGALELTRTRDWSPESGVDSEECDRAVLQAVLES